MRQNGNIQVQDPSASPTFTLSRPAANPDVPPSLRRNLFGSHLSRRAPVPFPNAPTDHMPDPFQSMSPTRHNSQSETHQALAQHGQQPIHPQHDIYQSRYSPSRSLSPTKSQPYTLSSSSIVVLDPTTGRPQLPTIPQLPLRMPESSEEEDEDEDGIEDEDGPEDDHTAAWRRMKAFEKANVSQQELDLHSSSIIGGISTHQSYLHELIDASAGTGDYRDFEKIESILSEMQSQQKARARTAVMPDTSSSLTLETPSESVISARTRGKAKAVARSQSEQNRSNGTGGYPRVGGVGATLSPADKDELLGLIMTSLSRRVLESDEDAWIFGDERTAANGVSVSGSFNLVPRDELGVDY